MQKAVLPSKKTFTAELKRRQRLAGDSGDSIAPVSVNNGEVLDEIRRLQHELHAMHQLVRDHFAPNGAGADGEEETPEDDPILRQYERQREEVNILKMELRALANSIQETKREIAQLRSGEEDSDRLNAVTYELDAVVGATERATDGILDAAEKIDTIAHNLRANDTDAYTTQLAEEITEHVMTIFEHSNFQDITGQRISKVVHTLKFVEERVDKMIDIWGRDAFMDLLTEDGPATEDEENRLLNGPQQDGAGISQDEIDKLFD